jgi:hypothetical protein
VKTVVNWKKHLEDAETSETLKSQERGGLETLKAQERSRHLEETSGRRRDLRDLEITGKRRT